MGLVRSASDDLLYAGVGGVPAGASVVWGPGGAGRGRSGLGRWWGAAVALWSVGRVVGGCCGWSSPVGWYPCVGCRGGSVGGAVGGCILGYLVIGFVASLAELGNKLFGTL